MKKLFYKLPKNIANCYSIDNLFWQLVAFALTYILVTTGFDWRYFKATRGSTLQSFLWPAVIIGFFVPLILPITLYLIGLFKKKIKIIYTAFAVAQAGILGLGISSFYKVFTGRPGPHALSSVTNSLIDISHIFRFGILRGGAFQGWPSSHTATAFAMSFALVAMYPKNKLIKYLAIIYAFYIGLSVSTNIHWFSDFVAGAILGTIIGYSVGKGFFDLINNNNSIGDNQKN